MWKKQFILLLLFCEHGTMSKTNKITFLEKYKGVGQNLFKSRYICTCLRTVQTLLNMRLKCIDLSFKFMYKKYEIVDTRSPVLNVITFAIAQ